MKNKVKKQKYRKRDSKENCVIKGLNVKKVVGQRYG